jgi:protein involved in polysaccharide export with SLBB domain
MKKVFPITVLSLITLFALSTSISGQFGIQDPKPSDNASSYKAADRNDRRNRPEVSENRPDQANDTDDALQAQKLFETGTASYEAGRLEDAITALSQAAKLRPDDSQTHFNLGMAYQQAKSYKEAADSFKRAVKIKPDWPEANFRLGMMSYVLGRKSQSQDAYQKLLKMGSPLANTLYRIIKEEDTPPPPATLTKAPASSAPTQTQTKQAAESMTVPAAKKESGKTKSKARPDPVSLSNENVALKPVANETAQPVEPAPVTKPATVDQNLSRIYKVGVGDILDVRLLNSTIPGSTLFTVMDGGLIDLPLAGGPIAVAGLTTDEIQGRIGSELKRRAVEGNATVSVGVRQYTSHTVIVTGMVANSGTRVLRREAVPLYVLMAEVQPRSDAGRVTILRAGSNGLSFDLNHSADLSALVLPGDVINIGPRPQEFYYIGGRVNFPGQKPFQAGITLLQAILAAGGTAQNDNTIDVSREGEGGRLTTTRFNLKEIKSGKSEDPRLQPGDRIEVVH